MWLVIGVVKGFCAGGCAGFASAGGVCGVVVGGGVISNSGGQCSGVSGRDGGC